MRSPVRSVRQARPISETASSELSFPERASCRSRAAATRALTIERAGGREALRESILDYCERELARLRADAPEVPFDFTCGFAGYLGYELKADLGGELVHRSPLPDAALVFCDRLIAFDHDQRRVHLLALADARGVAAADAWLATAGHELERLAPPAPPTPPAPAALSFAVREGRDAYLANIAACKHEIFEARRTRSA